MGSISKEKGMREEQRKWLGLITNILGILEKAIWKPKV